MTTSVAAVKAEAKRPAKTDRELVAKASFGWGNPVVYFIALLLVAVTFAPILWIVVNGFNSNSQMTIDPSTWPNPFLAENYATVLTSNDFWKPALNSTIAAVSTTAGVVLFGVMAAFVLARYNFVGRGVLYSVFAAGLMFPMSVAITPLFFIILNLGLMNNLLGVILPGIAFALPTTIIILVPFLRAIPKELEEAAMLDGASRMGFFWRIIVPLAVPGLVTVGILAFIGSWNGYMLPLFILNPENATLPLGAANFSTQHTTDTAMVLAYTSLSMIPALIFFSLFERRIVGGLTGAVKG